MNIKSLFSLTLLAALAAATGNAAAGLSPQELERLGKELTPMGAEKAGNKDGSIPAWTGGLQGQPAGTDPKVVYADPYASDKPLYTITAANMQQYQDKLAPGQMEMLKRYPTYKMMVYPSHRSAALPQSEYDSIKAEAGKTALAEGGNGILNIKTTSVAFPIPKSGAEVMWNHITRYRGESFTRYPGIFVVQRNGAFTPVSRIELIASAAFMKDPEPNRLFYYLQTDTAPSSVAGSAVLVHEPYDQSKEPRLAWVYNPGSRRVLRAPEIAHDSPGISVDGLATADDNDGFSGSPERFDWKLVGKKEMIVAYNTYRIVAKDVKPTDLVKPGHINQDLVRYELHRVWVVEGTLKPGKRHVYGKRVFYFDEDSWQMVHKDNYDGRGELWRVGEVHGMQYYDAPMFGTSSEVQYDLQSGRYLMTNVVNAAKPTKFKVKYDVSAFSTDALRRFSN